MVRVKIKTWCTAAIALVLAVVLSGCSSIPARVWMAPLDYGERLTEDEGPFVKYPTYAGFVVGAPLAILSLPINGLLEPPPDAGIAENVFVLPMESVMLFPSITGDIVGTPFWLVKEVLWDFPGQLFDGDDEPNPAGTK